LVISSHNSFRMLFDKIASVYFIWQLYRCTFVRYVWPSWRSKCNSSFHRSRKVDMNVRTWRRFHIKRTKTWSTTYVSACNFACDPTLRKRLQSLSCSYGRITSIPVKINFIAAPRCQFFHIVGTLYRIAILREPRGWNTTNSAAAELHRSPCSCSLFEMSSRPSFSILAFSNRAKSAMHYTRVKRRSGLRIRNQRLTPSCQRRRHARGVPEFCAWSVRCGYYTEVWGLVRSI